MSALCLEGSKEMFGRTSPGLGEGDVSFLVKRVARAVGLRMVLCVCADFVASDFVQSISCT